MFREKIDLKFKLFLRELFELKKNRIMALLVILFFIAVCPLIFAILLNKFYDNREKAILILPKMQEADYYSIQIDDDMHFLSPNFEKSFSKEKSNIVLSLEKKNGPYYWRYKTINENGSEGEWQDQLELKETVPKEDIFFFMEGKIFKTGEPINFYIFVRNKSKVMKDLSYNISVRSDLEENGKLNTEVDDILFGKISVGSNSYELKKVTMRTGDNLQIDRKFYAIASLEDYKSIVDFSIVPAYGVMINTRALEKGTDNRVGLMIVNTTNDTIKSIKVSMSTSSNLKISAESWNNREIIDLGPHMTEFLFWDVDILEVEAAEIVFDILSDGGSHSIQKTIDLHHSVSLMADLPNRNIAINKPAELKVKIANSSESPVIANLELIAIDPAGSIDGSVKVEEKTRMIEIGAGSEACALEFAKECTKEVIWNVVGDKFGAYDYYVRSNDSRMEIINGSSNFGSIHVSQNESFLDLTIESDEVELEKRTQSRGEAVNFDIKLKNYSDSSDVVKIQVVPMGTGWHTYMHDGNELKNNSEFTVNIGSNSSKTFRLVLSPYDKVYEGNKFIFSNPLRVEVVATSKNDQENKDKVYASAFLDE